MKKPGKLGKFRPIILWFSVPLLVSSWMLYAAKWIMPDASTTAYTIYMYVFYVLMGSVYLHCREHRLRLDGPLADPGPDRAGETGQLPDVRRRDHDPRPLVGHRTADPGERR
jgi:hypothetical protein